MRSGPGDAPTPPGIFWLSSYPKSGNTWFRIFLANLLHGGDGPVNINRLEGVEGIAACRETFDDITGLASSDLTPGEIEGLRPEVYDYISSANPGGVFLKIHDAFTHASPGRPLVSPGATRGALYFIRNPLDVAVSLAHHLGCDTDTAIQRMGDPGFTLCGDGNRLMNQLPQKLTTWGGHVKSWVDSGVNLKVVAYEEMKLRPESAFKEALDFLGIETAPENLRRALRHSDFDALKKQEASGGFFMRDPRSPSFFRKGIVGSYRETLSPRQIRRLIHDHREMMLRFGYLLDNDTPRY